jgi:hypothetical protein
VQELAEYLGTMQSSLRVQELLIQIAQRSDAAAEQARICLTWHPLPTDLSYLAAVLTAPGDTDPRGTDRSSLPYSLVKAYGDDALPYLERAVANSPYVWLTCGSALNLHSSRFAIGPSAFSFCWMPSKPINRIKRRWWDGSRIFSRESFPAMRMSNRLSPFARQGRSWLNPQE